MGVRSLSSISASAPLLLMLSAGVQAQGFDHDYSGYAQVLAQHVRGDLVDYALLKTNRGTLDTAVAAFDAPVAHAEPTWTREQRMAFWINAYNAFTLRAIVDHYPIRASWFSRGPRNSIRQIPGVWTTLPWRAAGRRVTLDDIEHKILRGIFKDARIHFALNCASIGCPPLAAVPYRAVRLDTQLDEAGRRYLAGPQGLRLDSNDLRVSSIFKWYGEDFIPAYSSDAPTGRDAKERAIRGAVIRFGSAEAARRAKTDRTPLRFLDYDWSLNDVARAGLGRTRLAIGSLHCVIVRLGD